MAEFPCELDVRTLPVPHRHPEIVGTFDALQPGEAFVLVNDHDPKALLYQFQAERSNRFDWAVLERGPERYRVEIRRRAAEGPRSVTECLEADHRRLDVTVPEVQRLVAAGSFPVAGMQFAAFVCGLGQHIEAEEQVLFPAFESMTGIMAGPTVVMRSEHVDIRRQMSIVQDALAVGDAVAVAAGILVLSEILSQHNRKEEQVLYPMADQAAGSDDARAELVRRIQAC